MMLYDGTFLSAHEWVRTANDIIRIVIMTYSIYVLEGAPERDRLLYYSIAGKKNM